MFSTFSTRWRCVRSNFTEEGVFCWWFHESVWGYRFIWWIKEGINVFHCWCAFSIQYLKSNLKNILPYLKQYFYFLPCMHPSNPLFSLFSCQYYPILIIVYRTQVILSFLQEAIICKYVFMGEFAWKKVWCLSLFLLGFLPLNLPKSVAPSIRTWSNWHWWLITRQWLEFGYAELLKILMMKTNSWSLLCNILRKIVRGFCIILEWEISDKNSKLNHNFLWYCLFVCLFVCLFSFL